MTTLTPTAYGQFLASMATPPTEQQVESAARILAGVEVDAA
jgi:hypothetical protein